MKNLVVVFLLSILLNGVIFYGCTKKEDITNVTQVVSPQPQNRFKGNWTAKSVKLVTVPPPSLTSYTGYTPLAWKNFVINSGIVTTFGEITVIFTDTNFTISGNLSSSLLNLFPNGLSGNVAGKYLLPIPVKQYINVGVEDSAIQFIPRTCSPANMIGEINWWTGDYIQPATYIFANDKQVTLIAEVYHYVYDPNNSQKYDWLIEKFTIVLQKN